MIMNLGLVDSLRGLVRRKSFLARSSQDVALSETQLAVLQNGNGVPFQLRYCPSLAKKPVNDKPKMKEDKPKFDPFENPPEAQLVARIPAEKPSHILVLNKFPIIPNHFILATQTNKPQRGLLEADDLAMSYACLQAWEESEKSPSDTDEHHSLFCFFNSGDHSGASQPHRHLQFLPVEDMAATEQGEWDPLIRRMTSQSSQNPVLVHDADIPFIHFAIKLKPSISLSELYENYLTLMNAALSAIPASEQTSQNDTRHLVRDGETTFSYNLGMTTDTLAILPRSNEGTTLPGIDSSHIVLNGTILAGTLMVKAQSEWDRLRQEPKLIDHVLVNIGFPQSRGNFADVHRL